MMTNSLTTGAGNSSVAVANTIHYVTANNNITFARLAEHVKLDKYDTEQLRLLNGYYPSSEPKLGT